MRLNVEIGGGTYGFRNFNCDVKIDLEEPKDIIENFIIAEGGAPLVVTTTIKATKRCKMAYLCIDPTPMNALNSDTLADLVGFSDLIIAVSKMALDDTKKSSRVKDSIVIYPFPNNNFMELSKKDVPIKDDSMGVFIGTQTKWKGAHLLPELAKKLESRNLTSDFLLWEGLQWD